MNKNLLVLNVTYILSAVYAVMLMLTIPAYAQNTDAEQQRDMFWRDIDASLAQNHKPYAIPIIVSGEPALKQDLRLTIPKAKVIKVIDEQTLVLENNQTIQLAGLYFVYNRNGKGPDALATYEFLNKEFLDKYVNVYQRRNETEGRKNGFGHEIGYVERIDGVWAQGTILASGLGRVYATAENPELAERMLDIESKARKTQEGYWKNPQWQIKDAQDVKDIEQDFNIVEGTIHSVSQRENNIYLNFGENWRNDFTVQIPSEQRKLFSRLGTNPLDWANKKMRVRGWVEEYNGPMIKILHPLQVELIDETVPVQYIEQKEFLE